MVSCVDDADLDVVVDDYINEAFCCLGNPLKATEMELCLIVIFDLSKSFTRTLEAITSCILPFLQGAVQS
jgi:hypothetical protein